METLKKRLIRKLTLADPGLVGCRRRNRWDQRDETPWRWLRGNALLATLGERTQVYTDLGPLEFFKFNRWLLQFRGGQWNTDWIDDFIDLWCLVRAGGVDLSHTIMVVHENQGDLDIKMVSVDEAIDFEAHAARLSEEYNADPPVRIRKDGSRAIRMCRYCPHKQKCDAIDKIHANTADWGPNYPYP